MKICYFHIREESILVATLKIQLAEINLLAVIWR